MWSLTVTVKTIHLRQQVIQVTGDETGSAPKSLVHRPWPRGLFHGLRAPTAFSPAAWSRFSASAGQDVDQLALMVFRQSAPPSAHGLAAPMPLPGAAVTCAASVISVPAELQHERRPRNVNHNRHIRLQQ
ncbi:MAG: hypothetical protein IPM84_15035 [Anaerolineae bacterium]|nr:hypothetical protein [Anaerolineae bacterium]